MKAAVATYDMSKSAKEKVIHEFQWNSEGTFSDSTGLLPSSPMNSVFSPLLRTLIIYSIGAAVGNPIAWVKDFNNKLEIRGWISVTLKNPRKPDESEWVVEARRKEGGKGRLIDAQLNNDINASLNECVEDVDLPKGETWTLSGP